MKTLSFTATESEVVSDEEEIIAGVGHSDSGQYVTFQRDAEDSDEDWGIHFGFNDQINGTYECIRRCSVSRGRLLVELKEPIDWQNSIHVVDIALEITSREFDTFIKILRRIFRGHETMLHIAADPIRPNDE